MNENLINVLDGIGHGIDAVLVVMFLLLCCIIYLMIMAKSVSDDVDKNSTNLHKRVDHLQKLLQGDSGEDPWKINHADQMSDIENYKDYVVILHSGHKLVAQCIGRVSTVSGLPIWQDNEGAMLHYVQRYLLIP